LIFAPTATSAKARTEAIGACFRNGRSSRFLSVSAYDRFLVLSARTGLIGYVGKGEDPMRAIGGQGRVASWWRWLEQSGVAASP